MEQSIVTVWRHVSADLLQAFHIQFVTGFNTVFWVMKHAQVVYYHTICALYITIQGFLLSPKLVDYRLDEYFSFQAILMYFCRV